MSRLPVLDRKRAGILLHPTSLPSARLGEDAHRFVDFLADSGASVWQMLPLAPTHRDGSPYHCFSVHALNPPLLSVQRLLDFAGRVENRMDRDHCLDKALTRLRRPKAAAQRAAFESFCVEQAYWLDDFSLYCVLRARYQGSPWWQWPSDVRDRELSTLNAAAAELVDALTRTRLEQFLVAEEFTDLRTYAHSRGVRLFGDMPIFVAHDSADVWAHRSYFKLDAQGQPTVVTGVPPDYFSAGGQRWGNPHYNWAAMQADSFRWWRDRLSTELQRFDLIRIDHFRGFEASWEIPANEPTAINGHWAAVPGDALFTTLRNHLGDLPLVAEDLGTITPEVRALRHRNGLPGMLVLQFAFDGAADNPYLPRNHTDDAVVYTGTHDNDTTLSWFQNLSKTAQQQVLAILNTNEPMPRALVQAALDSVARLAIIPLQDVLELGADQRMNTPGTTQGNWKWRFGWERLSETLVERWKAALAASGRAVYATD